jgi:hypothetical protein
MTRINIFKTSLAFSRFFIIFGSIFACLGMFLIIRAFLIGFNTQFPSGDWNSVIYTFQGLLFIIMGSSNLINRKYYIEWDDNELRFFLPKTNNPETLKFADILTIDIKLFQIQLGLNDRKITIDLDNLQFEDLKRIKEKFEAINKLSSKSDSCSKSFNHTM